MAGCSTDGSSPDDLTFFQGFLERFADRFVDNSCYPAGPAFLFIAGKKIAIKDCLADSLRKIATTVVFFAFFPASLSWGDKIC